MKTTATFLLFLLSAGFLPAQETTKPVLPSGPAIQKWAPDMAKWVVATRAANAPSAAPANGVPEAPGAAESDEKKHWIPVTTVTKTGNIYHVRMVDSQNEVWHIWADGSVTVVESGTRAGAAFVAPSPDSDWVNPLFVDFSESDFEGFGWVSAANYRGTNEFMGRMCLIFRDKVKVGTVEADPEAGRANSAVDLYEPREAYVDLETRLPVALSGAEGWKMFTFFPPPASMQSLPECVKELVSKQRELDDSLARRPRKPY